MLTTIFISHINACKRFSQCTHVEIHTRGTNIITTGSAHACTQTHTHAHTTSGADEYEAV